VACRLSSQFPRPVFGCQRRRVFVSDLVGSTKTDIFYGLKYLSRYWPNNQYRYPDVRPRFTYTSNNSRPPGSTGPRCEGNAESESGYPGPGCHLAAPPQPWFPTASPPTGACRTNYRENYSLMQLYIGTVGKSSWRRYYFCVSRHRTAREKSKSHPAKTHLSGW
jgi:hypothetical protein